MSSINFIETRWEVGGEVYRSGEVVRLKTDEGEAWADMVIMGFGFHGSDAWVQLSRPIAHVMNPGVTPRVTLSFESLEISVDKLPVRFARLGKQRDGFSSYVL